MKNLRYILTTLLAFSAVEAFAWTAEVNRAILLFAEQHLTSKSKKEFVEIYGAPLSSIKFEEKGEIKSRLNESGKSVTTDAKDGVVRLEKAIATLQNPNSSPAERKEALRTAIETTVDIHCPANILIDKHLEEDFEFGRDNGRPKGSRWFRVTPYKWRAMWHKRYHTNLGAFSAEMYLYDWNIATKGMAKSYKKQPLAPRKWAEQTGERVFRSLKTFQPKAVVNMLEITKQAEVNNSCMYDAAFRLANLINQTLK